MKQDGQVEEEREALRAVGRVVDARTDSVSVSHMSRLIGPPVSVSYRSKDCLQLGSRHLGCPYVDIRYAG